MRAEEVPVTQEIKVFDVNDFSEYGDVNYESWGVHYTDEYRGYELIKEILSPKSWSVCRVSNTGLKTLSKETKAEKVIIVNPYTGAKENAILLTNDDGGKLLLDVNHLPYTIDAICDFREITFYTGLIMTGYDLGGVRI